MKLSRRKRQPDRGGGPVELAILLLPILLLSFIVAQAAFVFYARSTALAAATQGANAGRAYNAAPTAGTDGAQNFLNQVKNGGLKNTSVTTTRTGNEVTVVVSGQASSIIPFLTFSVSQHATGPVERWVP